jgi:hypothetical protein
MGGQFTIFAERGYETPGEAGFVSNLFGRHDISEVTCVRGGRSVPGYEYSRLVAAPRLLRWHGVPCHCEG